MNAREAHALLGRALFLDVREPYEYEAGHIQGSLHIPIGEIAERWSELPEDADVVVVCQVGQRSHLVTEFLTARALRAQNLEGGLTVWSADGFPLISGGGEGEIVDGYARNLDGTRVNPD